MNSFVLCLFSHSLIAWSSWHHLAWQVPIHIVRLRSAIRFSMEPFWASLLPKGRITFLVVTCQLPVVVHVCMRAHASVCVHASVCMHLCVCVCICVFIFASAMCVTLWILSVWGSGSITLHFFVDFKLLGNWAAFYSSFFL